MQLFAVNFILLQDHSARCPHPSSGVHRPVTTASGTGPIIVAATFSQRDQTWSRWKKVAATIIWPPPEAVDTV